MWSFMDNGEQSCIVTELILSIYSNPETIYVKSIYTVETQIYMLILLEGRLLVVDGNELNCIYVFLS